MRYILPIFLLLFYISSNKKNETNCDSGLSVIGKWQAEKQFQSPRTGGEWHDLPLDERFQVEFKPNGSINYSSNFPAAFFYDNYLDNSLCLIVTSSVTGKSDTWTYTMENGCILVMSIFTCFEGCAYKLKRLQ